MDICIYHNADLDGFCSAAIWKTKHPNGILVGMNHGQDVPWEMLVGEDVTLVDFCLQPWKQMERLMTIARPLTWIDHHESSIKELAESSSLPLRGVRDTKKAACELTWKFYYPGEPMPRGVFLLGDYDCWRHSDPDTMPYQMGMRLEEMDPGQCLTAMGRWERVFGSDGEFTADILRQGEIILKYQTQQNARTAKAIWFPIEFEGLKWQALNAGGVNSQVWDSIWDESFDGKLAFVRSRKHWTVTMYSTTVDCGEIARQRGGGGHHGAAGFQAENLPFSFGR